MLDADARQRLANYAAGSTTGHTAPVVGFWTDDDLAPT
jgi:hypothetical protein